MRTLMKSPFLKCKQVGIELLILLQKAKQWKGADLVQIEKKEKEVRETLEKIDKQIESL